MKKKPLLGVVRAFSCNECNVKPGLTGSMQFLSSFYLAGDKQHMAAGKTFDIVKTFYIGA